MNSQQIIRTMRIVNFVNGLAMVTSAILQLIAGLVGVSFQTVMLALYTAYVIAPLHTVRRN